MRHKRGYRLRPLSIGFAVTGFVCLHREALNHPLLKDPSRLGAWFWLVAKAAWKPTPFDVNGKIITLERGQLCVSFRKLSTEWGWSKATVEHFFLRLKSETMIRTSSETGRTIVTICNYAKYQDINLDNKTPSRTPSRTPTGHQPDTKEQGNKLTSNLLDKSNKINSRESLPKSIPKDWQPMLTPATQKIVDGWQAGMIERQINDFKDHAATHGRKAKDWQAAFRTWVRKANDWIEKNDNRNHNTKPEPSLNPLAQAVLNRRDERIGRESGAIFDNASHWTQ